jgi:hypothetical protein
MSEIVQGDGSQALANIQYSILFSFANKRLGGMYGSIHLNIAFEQHIVYLVGNRRYKKISESRKQKMRNQFEDLIKPEISLKILATSFQPLNSKVFQTMAAR